LDYKSPESNKGKKRFPLDVDALFPNIKEKESKRKEMGVLLEFQS
jgi:hypothetical protein